MAKYLKEFIKELVPEDFYFNSDLNKMIAHLNKHAPSEMTTLCSPHYSEIYKNYIRNSRRKTLFATFLIEYLMLYLSPKAPYLHPERVSFWENAEPGMSDLTVDQYGVGNHVKRSLYLKYMPFKFFGHGNCCSRSAYAGINLHGIFSQVRGDIKIVLKSYIEEYNVDHYVLKIGNENIGWYIYDPLTNPEIIFNEHEYQQDIFPMFPKYAGRAIPTYIEITSDFVTHCNNLEAEFHTFFSRKFRGLNENSLKKNTEFMYAIEKCTKLICKEDINPEVIKDLANCLHVQDETLNTSFNI